MSPTCNRCNMSITYLITCIAQFHDTRIFASSIESTYEISIKSFELHQCIPYSKGVKMSFAFATNRIRLLITIIVVWYLNTTTTNNIEITCKNSSFVSELCRRQSVCARAHSFTKYQRCRFYFCTPLKLNAPTK